MFRYPKGWSQFDLADGRDGVMFSPQSDNPSTWFSAWSSALPYPVVAEDVDALREGVNEGLSHLDDLHVEFESEDVHGNLCRFERIYRCRDGEALRKRRVWMIYVYTWLFVLTAQGDDAETYDYWSIMLNNCFQSFEMAPELWFAGDQETFPVQEQAS